MVTNRNCIISLLMFSIFFMISFLLFFKINNELYHLSHQISNVSLLFLLELIVSIFGAYRADKLTVKYAINSKKTKECNPFARFLYKSIGNKTLLITFAVIILFFVGIYVVYYKFNFLRLINIEIFVPIITGMTIGDWLNDELHAHFINKKSI